VGVPTLVPADHHVGSRTLLADGRHLALDSCARSGGGACIVNAGRCGRLHCYITGPFFLLAAVYVVLAEFHIVPLQPGRFLLVVFVVSVAACLAEFPLGSYVKKAGPTR